MCRSPRDSHTADRDARCLPASRPPLPPAFLLQRIRQPVPQEVGLLHATATRIQKLSTCQAPPLSFLSRKWSPFSRLGSNSASSGRPTSAVPRYTATPRLHPLHTTWCQILTRMNKRLKLSFLSTIVPEPEAVLEGNWKCSRYPQTAEHYRPKEPYWSHKIEPQPHPGAPLKSKDSYATCQPQKLWWGTRCHDSAGSTLNTVTEDLLSTGHHTSYAQRTTRTPH